jgi:hypothetical protein
LFFEHFVGGLKGVEELDGVLMTVRDGSESGREKLTS